MHPVLIPRYITMLLGRYSSFFFRRLGRALRPGSRVGFPLWGRGWASRSGPGSWPGPGSGDRWGLWLGSPGRSGFGGGARPRACARPGFGSTVAGPTARPRAAPASRSAATASSRATTHKERKKKKKRRVKSCSRVTHGLERVLRDREGGTGRTWARKWALRGRHCSERVAGG